MENIVDTDNPFGNMSDVDEDEESIINIPDNIIQFIDSCSNTVAKQAEEKFNIEMWQDINTYDIISPIEQRLYIALNTIIKINYIGKYSSGSEIIITPQYNINNYRVDFLLTHMRDTTSPIDTTKQLIIECDSQEWHERIEKERRYEKQRDRCFTTLGYKTIHFTGKEINDDALVVAVEILSLFTGIEQDDLIKEV